MTEYQFKMHFRMSPDTFEDLLQKMDNTLAAYNLHIHDNMFPKTPIDKEVMITVWYLSNIESFRSVADRFEISKSTCWDILYSTCKLLLLVNRHCKIISWPTRRKQIEISNNFNINGFEGIIGSIDGSHIIKIVAPSNNSNSYVNRKGFHSLLLQAVCDHRMLFTNVYAGEKGSPHDYTLCRRSELYLSIQTQRVRFYDDTHLVGDLAYKLHTNLIVGFKNNGHLTLRQKNFNPILSKIRVKIENLFAYLKGRFRRLKFLETTRLDLASLLIISTCILHNVCILNGDLMQDIIDIDEEQRQENANNPHNFGDIDEEQVENDAIIKRYNIVNHVPIILGN